MTEYIGIQAMMNRLTIGNLGLPSLQREYVWSNQSVLKFFESIYKNRPLGSQVHIWKPKSERIEELVENGKTFQGYDLDSTKFEGFIIDGQQRLTSLLRVWHNGAIENSIDLLFDPVTETFSVSNLKTSKMAFTKKDNASDGNLKRKQTANTKYLRLTELWKDTKYLDEFIALLRSEGKITKSEIDSIEEKATKFVSNISSAGFHCEVLNDIEIDEVINIFELLNSGGKKVNESEKVLTPLLIQASPAIKKKINDLINEVSIKKFGSMIDMNFMTSLIVYQLFGYNNVKKSYEKSFHKESITEKEITAAFDIVSAGLRRTLELLKNLGIESKNLIESKFPIQVMSLAIGNRIKRDDGKLLTLSNPETNQILFYFIVANAKARYSEKNNMKLRESDIALAGSDGAIGKLAKVAESYRDAKSRLWFEKSDLIKARYAQGRSDPLIVLLALVLHSNDAESLEGEKKIVDFSIAQKHHIFPQSRSKEILGSLSDNGAYNIHCIANITYINGVINRDFSNDLPKKYFPKLAFLEGYSGDAKLQKLYEVLDKHMIPVPTKDYPLVWQSDGYQTFIDQRLQLLTDKFNEFINEWAG